MCFLDQIKIQKYYLKSFISFKISGQILSLTGIFFFIELAPEFDG